MTGLDWIIVAFTVLMAVWGFGQGLIAGALALAGFAAGAFVGSRLGPLLLEEGSHSPYAPAVRADRRADARRGPRLGARGAGLPPAPPARRAGSGCSTGSGGSVAGGLPRAFLVWIGGAVALQTPGARELREPIQRSAILQGAQRGPAALGADPPGARALRPVPADPRAVRERAAAERARSRATREVRAAGRSVVKVLGTACGLGVQGSGWVAGDGLVVTNAHVVAGQDDTTVQLGGEGAVASTPRRSGSTPATTSRSCARPGVAGRAGAAA